MLKCIHFRFSLGIEEEKIECAKKILFNFHSIYFTRDICANALFVSNVGIIISYCCKMSFYSIVVSFLFPFAKILFCKYWMFQRHFAILRSECKSLYWSIRVIISLQSFRWSWRKVLYEDEMKPYNCTGCTKCFDMS